MDYLEFIARVTAHFPDKGQVMVRPTPIFIDYLKLTLLSVSPLGGY